MKLSKEQIIEISLDINENDIIKSINENFDDYCKFVLQENKLYGKGNGLYYIIYFPNAFLFRDLEHNV